MRPVINVGIIDDIGDVIRRLEAYRNTCNGPCGEIDYAIGKLRSIVNDVGVMLDFISRVYSESQRLLLRYFTTKVNVEARIVEVIMNNNDEYLDDLVKRINIPPDQLIRLLNVLKSSGLVDYFLKYDNGVRVLIRKSTSA